MGVVIGGFLVAKAAEGVNHGVLRFRLARINHVVDFGHVAEVGMVRVAGGGRNPALVGVGIAEKFAVGEIAAQQTELPHVVGDVFAHVADGTVGADDHFLIVFGDFTGFFL